MQSARVCRSFFFNDTATTEIYTLSLHDALPISSPAPFSSRTVCPRLARACTPPGTSPTRYSRVLTSLGQPTIIRDAPFFELLEKGAQDSKALSSVKPRRVASLSQAALRRRGG